MSGDYRTSGFMQWPVPCPHCQRCPTCGQAPPQPSITWTFNDTPFFETSNGDTDGK